MALLSPFGSPLVSFDNKENGLPPPLLSDKENHEPDAEPLSKQRRKVTFISPVRQELAAVTVNTQPISIATECHPGENETQQLEEGEDPWSELRDLDDMERWSERSTVVTKADHAAYLCYAREIVEDLVSNLACYHQEEFRSASEMFSTQGVSEFELDFLDNVGTGATTDAALARQSLYVRFDPLVQKNTPDKAMIQLAAISEPTSAGSDLLQLDTPRPASAVPRRTAGIIANPVLASPFATPGTQSATALACEDKASAAQSLVCNTPRTALDFDHVSSSSRGQVNLLENTTPLLCREAARSSAECATAAAPATCDGQDLQFTEADLQARIHQEVAEAVNKAREQMNAEAAVHNQELERLQAERVKLRQQSAERDIMLDEVRRVAEECKAAVNQSADKSDAELSGLINDRNQLSVASEQLHRDVESLDNSFVDLFGRYEKLRHCLGALEKATTEAKEKEKAARTLLDEAALKNRRLKESAEEKMRTANSGMEQARKDNASEAAILKANLKKATLRFEGLQRSIQQKENDNKKLTSICDEMMAQMQSNIQQ